jgi:beta-ketoacyl-acyl-carrier-protein synthase II
MDRKSARHLSRSCQFALAASRRALAHAGFDPAEHDPDHIGVIVATAASGLEEIERGHTAMIERGPRRMSPFTAPMMITNMASGVVAMHTRAGGPNYALVSACSSSTHALGEAAEIIRRGGARAMLAGGTEATVTALAFGAFCQIKAISTRNDDPAHACRPFDAGRDGFVMGEGAAMLVLEDAEFARARGASPLAELAGYGATNDMYHFVAPHPEGDGAARAMRLALRQAGRTPDQVDYINAHGTSTRVGDIAETKAIKAVFGDAATGVPISSTKSVHAHMFGATGAVEAIACVLALREGEVPPTINLEDADPECDLDYVANVSRPVRVSTAMSNSSGFGGHNATLVLTAP